MKVNCTKKLSDILFENAVIFLNEAVSFMNKGIIERKNMVLAIVNIQIAIELALKSSVTNFFGIRTVLIDKQAKLSDEEIERLFEENKIKLKEYESLKNFTKSKSSTVELYNFEQEQYKYMERFQDYRNKILHCSYIFSDAECERMEKDIIYVLIHILGILMTDRRDEAHRKFVQEYLRNREYSKLLKNPIYNRELQRFLEKEFDVLYICPFCDMRTLTPHKYCARCLTNFDVSKEIYAFVKCGYCQEKMIICDALNIETNGNVMKGVCLNCREDTTVYKCPICKQFVNLELLDRKECHVGFCKWEK